jgi:hypothetical protein
VLQLAAAGAWGGLRYPVGPACSRVPPSTQGRAPGGRYLAREEGGCSDRLDQHRQVEDDRIAMDPRMDG